MSLRDTATELLGSIEGSSAAFQAKENLDMIGDRLGSLLQCVLDYMGQIEGRLNIKRDPSVSIDLLVKGSSGFDLHTPIFYHNTK